MPIPLQMVSHPASLFLILFCATAVVTTLGALVLREKIPLDAHARNNFNVIHAATLTLFGLLVGFTLSMSVSRYDSRKHDEQEEASAISTAYLRADLLGESAGVSIKSILLTYLDLRIRDYATTDEGETKAIVRETERLQDRLWREVSSIGLTRSDPVMATVIGSVNEVLNAQGYTQAAWRNRIPAGVWALLLIIALLSSVMQGYIIRGPLKRNFSLLILPFSVSLSIALIADIDSPRGGLIRVVPQNLTGLAASIAPTEAMRRLDPMPRSAP
ncbi:hypothetical protein [Pandoraea bronchicola]|uniref:DUF4239 domain-containing protein n=1 Tax=Pandoraea bronchicola TaxID=2508287 RepID=A0A5E5C1V8_9BURK|nr:hypothetical protein [Pandoraea bronchicola]VVE90533.1 hypothetical protein PBR20603_04518 [Pandoraea bronchicola]